MNKDILILNEIQSYCIHNCTKTNSCADEECILRRIEKIISGDKGVNYE